MRVSLLCAGLVALAACDIPAAVFDGGNQTTTFAGGSSTGGSSTGGTTTTLTDSTTSASGGGGSTGGTGGTTTTSTTTTGPTVPCGWPADPTYECAPGQVCCFDKMGTDADVCGAPSSCDPPTKYAELKCNENADCASDKVCCAFYALDPDQKLRVQRTYCSSACNPANQEIATCTDSACADGDLCTPFYAPTYTTYKFCLPLP